MVTREHEGQTYRELQAHELIETGDIVCTSTGFVYISSYCTEDREPVNKCAAEDNVGRYWRLVPDPETREHDGKIYRRLEVGEIVESRDFVSGHAHTPMARCVHSSGNEVFASDYWMYWRESEKFVASDGACWNRLPAGALIYTTDKTGIIEPSNDEPEGLKVRKSRHVWRRAVVLPDYKHYEYRSQAKVASFGLSEAMSALKAYGCTVDYPAIQRAQREAERLEYAKAATMPRGWVDPDKHIAEDGRPWRRLEVGEKIRKCDRHGIDAPGDSFPGPSHVGAHRWVWRPAGPPVETIEHEGKEYRRMRDDETLEKGDIYASGVNRSGKYFSTKDPGTKATVFKYYREIGKAPVPKAPPRGFMDYLRTQTTTVAGYGPADLVRYLESVR